MYHCRFLVEVSLHCQCAQSTSESEGVKILRVRRKKNETPSLLEQILSLYHS